MKELGAAELLGAEAIGQPGQRRFRLFVRTPGSSAILWMEKEQLLNLSLVIDRALAQISDGRILRTEARAGGLSSTLGDMPGDFPTSTAQDFQVGQLRLGLDGERNMFVLTAVPYEVTENEGGQPQPHLLPDETLSFLFSIEQAQHLTARITSLMEGGRPACPLCHAPLDGGPHTCINQNGHREILQMLDEEGQPEE